VKKVSLPFVDQMPDRPLEKPLDWKLIADRFDAYIMNQRNRVKFSDPDGFIRFGAFVEDGGHELITFGGIVLGKILRGDEVEGFLPSLKSYFSHEFGIFMNHPNNKREEYWYLMLVNCYAFEIIRRKLFAHQDYKDMIKKSLQTLIKISQSNQYDFNDQGYNFESGSPFTNKDAYRQPDTIGAYSYLMLVGYELFGDRVYLKESIKAMTYYQTFENNPWYEIPSGSMACLAAAKLNSMGFSFDLNKIMNFVLDPNQGPLHIGKWGTSEVNGLMRGWRGYSREEASQTAYSLETLLLLPFIVPMIKYQPNLANTIAKYVLHVAANSRWFFGDYMDEAAQSRPELPPDVPYETLHIDKNGYQPFAFGDFHTHKSVYGGAFTYWWDSIVKKTNHPYILQIDISKTDFFSTNDFQIVVYYNPLEEEESITVEYGDNKLFDLQENQLINTNRLIVPPKSSRIIGFL
jgi:hypothetical protein